MTFPPPWILFIDKGKPVAILPAGRPGEVANVAHLTMVQAADIVRMANEIHGKLTEAKMLALEETLTRTLLSLAAKDILDVEEGSGT